MSENREYEVTLIVSAQLTDADSQKLIDKYEKIMLADGGHVLKKSVWGTKKLAYPIKSQFRGHYINYDLLGRPENIKEAERLMRIDEGVLRYLSIKIGEDVDIETRKAEIAKEEARAAEEAAKMIN